MRSGKEIIINAPTVCCCKLEIIIVAFLKNILEKAKFVVSSDKFQMKDIKTPTGSAQKWIYSLH